MRKDIFLKIIKKFKFIQGYLKMIDMDCKNPK